MSRRLSPYVNWEKVEHKNWSRHEKPRTVTKDHGYHAVRGWGTTLDIGYSRGMGITLLKCLATPLRPTQAKMPQGRFPMRSPVHGRIGRTRPFQDPAQSPRVSPGSSTSNETTSGISTST